MKRGPTVPPAVRRGPVGSRWGLEGPWGRRRVPYGSLHHSFINTGLQNSRAIRRGPSGPVVPKQVSNGNRSEPVMAREDPTGPDESLDSPVSVYD